MHSVSMHKVRIKLTPSDYETYVLPAAPPQRCGRMPFAPGRVLLGWAGRWLGWWLAGRGGPFAGGAAGGPSMAWHARTTGFGGPGTGALVLLSGNLSRAPLVHLETRTETAPASWRAGVVSVPGRCLWLGGISAVLAKGGPGPLGVYCGYRGPLGQPRAHRPLLPLPNT